MNACVSKSLKCKVLSDQFAGYCFDAVELIHDSRSVDSHPSEQGIMGGRNTYIFVTL